MTDRQTETAGGQTQTSIETNREDKKKKKRVTTNPRKKTTKIIPSGGGITGGADYRSAQVCSASTFTWLAFPRHYLRPENKLEGEKLAVRDSGDSSWLISHCVLYRGEELVWICGNGVCVFPSSVAQDVEGWLRESCGESVCVYCVLMCETLGTLETL